MNSRRLMGFPKAKDYTLPYPWKRRVVHHSILAHPNFRNESETAFIGPLALGLLHLSHPTLGCASALDQLTSPGDKIVGTISCLPPSERALILKEAEALLNRAG